MRAAKRGMCVQKNKTVKNYTLVIMWSTFFAENKLSLVMWFKSSGKFLAEYKNELAKIPSKTMIIPNWRNDALMEDYVKYYRPLYSTTDDLKQRIQKTVVLAKECGCTIKIYDGLIHYPAYVGNSTYVVGIHEFGKIGSITSPNFINSVDEFIQGQVDFIVKNSKNME
jgi:hypothetical protein